MLGGTSYAQRGAVGVGEAEDESTTTDDYVYDVDPRFNHGRYAAGSEPKDNGTGGTPLGE